MVHKAVMVNSKKKEKMKWNDAYLYLIPWAIGMVVFRLWPFIEAFRISLFFERIGRPAEFVGFENFANLFVGTLPVFETFRSSFWITIRYVLLTVPLVLVVALFVAFILNFKIKGIAFFRTAFYIPSILGGSVSIAFLWRAVFGTTGLVNSFVGIFGIEGPGWMTDPTYSLLIMALLRAWQFGSVMLIFLSALQNVPASLYEAASIDGASKWRQFFSVTVPIITPTILFNTINLLVASFQEFNAPFLVFANPGGPGRAAYLLNLFIYDTAFVSGNFGVAATASWIMFLVIMIFTLIIFKFSDKYVFYND